MTHGGEIKVTGTDFKVSGNALDGEVHTMNCWPTWNWSAMLNLNAMEGG